MSKAISNVEAIKILRQTLYEIKDAPLSREEMIAKAEEGLRKLDWLETNWEQQ